MHNLTSIQFIQLYISFIYSNSLIRFSSNNISTLLPYTAYLHNLLQHRYVEYIE